MLAVGAIALYQLVVVIGAIGRLAHAGVLGHPAASPEADIMFFILLILVLHMLYIIPELRISRHVRTSNRPIITRGW